MHVCVCLCVSQAFIIIFFEMNQSHTYVDFMDIETLLTCIVLVACSPLQIPYSPEQVPMGACSLSVKIWGWAVTRRTRLNDSTIPMQGPTPDAKLAAMGLNGLASSVCLWFVEASPTVEKAVSCYKVDKLVASLLSFRSVQSSLAVCEFRAAGEECCKRGHRRVCANLWCLMSCRPKCIRTIAAIWAQWNYLRIHYARI